LMLMNWWPCLNSRLLTWLLLPESSVSWLMIRAIV